MYAGTAHTSVQSRQSRVCALQETFTFSQAQTVARKFLFSSLPLMVGWNIPNRGVLVGKNGENARIFLSSFLVSNP